MTDEKINIAITQLLGSYVHWEGSVPYASEFAEADWSKRKYVVRPLAPYASSLDEMHVAEKLCHDRQFRWITELAKVTHGQSVEGYMHYADVSAIAHATARERAEALLRTFDKWED